METRTFNQPLKLVEGWYWLIKSHKVKRGKAIAATLTGRDLVIYRTESGKIVVFDAYCPHMGAHLAMGKVHGDCLRCYFHNWAFDPDGSCVEVPSMEQPPAGLQVRAWPARDKHGLIWVWTGSAQPSHEVPEPPQLKETDYVSALGRNSNIECHPHVVMINAIDENHFQTVHQIPGHLMHLEACAESDRNIRFINTANPPSETALQRWISSFYKGSIFYELSYWYGTNGLVSMGPDFMRMYFMFALRPTATGSTEGQIVVFTPRRKGVLGWCLNHFILFMTRMVGRYFSSGDTKVFQTIRFDYKTPVDADRSVMTFIRHLEKQPLADWAQEAKTP
jgi:phenylpropionate dioxygenase-like ring-hydroxylating dioxygenase large terminal subunit